MKGNLKYLLSSAVFRLVLIVLAVLISLNLLTLALTGQVMTQAEERAGLEARHSLELYLSQADGAMSQVATAMNYLSRKDEDYLRLATKPIDDDIEQRRQIQASVNLHNTLSKKQDEHPLMSSIFAWFPEKDYFIQSSSGSRFMEQRTQVQRYLAEPDGGLPGGWYLLQEGDSPLLCFLAAFRGGYYGAWIELDRLAEPLGVAENWILAFTDGKGNVVYAGREGLPLLDPLLDECDYNGERCALVSVGSGLSELRLARILPRSEISGRLPAAIQVLRLLAFASILLIPVVMVEMQRWMVGPVRRLTDAMGRIEAGDLDYRISVPVRGSEFARINGSFNHMMDEVRDLKISLYEEQLKAEKIRIGFLAQQIRPHFILNALNILYSYEPEEYALSQRMILCLSKYFRYVVNAHRDFVPLGQELEHIRNYFEIQQARFKRTFRAEVRWEETLSQALVPPLLVQSFAENAIKHAFTPGEIIDIRVTAEKAAEELLQIEIIDTGAGISDQALERIALFRQDRKFRVDLGIGIQNSIDRLELLYGGRAALDIRRGDTGGTRVRLLLPIQYGEEAEISQL